MGAPQIIAESLEELMNDLNEHRRATMAFICDEDGDVMGWNELCVSYAPDHEAGMAECIEMLEAMR